VAAMMQLGARAEHMAAAIGPCIHQPSYEVAGDLRDAVMRQNPSDERFFAPGRREARWQFDLARYCAARLAGIGVTTVQLLDADTAADEERFFSYRGTSLNGGGPTGHQISIITLAG